MLAFKLVLQMQLVVRPFLNIFFPQKNHFVRLIKTHLNLLEQLAISYCPSNRYANEALIEKKKLNSK